MAEGAHAENASASARRGALGRRNRRGRRPSIGGSAEDGSAGGRRVLAVFVEGGNGSGNGNGNRDLIVYRLLGLRTAARQARQAVSKPAWYGSRAGRRRWPELP